MAALRRSHILKVRNNLFHLKLLEILGLLVPAANANYPDYNFPQLTHLPAVKRYNVKSIWFTPDGIQTVTAVILHAAVWIIFSSHTLITAGTLSPTSPQATPTG